MDPTRLAALGSDFVALLLLPTLGVIGLMHRRAIPVLRWTLVAWGVLGALALLTGQTLFWTRNRLLHVWGLGIALGSAFLLIAVLRNNRRVKPWVRYGLALLTLVAFVRALLAFLARYA
jgi:hypothetical protein